MPSFLKLLAVGVLSAVTVSAAPTDVHVQKRADGTSISQDLYDRFVLFSQFAAATFCDHNVNASVTGAKLTCDTNNCPLVQSADTKTVLEFSNGGVTDATGYVATDATHKLIVVAFRGSISLNNWLSDTVVVPTSIDLCDDCEAFTGAWLFYSEAREKIVNAVTEARTANPDYRLVIVGHSIGAGITWFAGAEFRNKGWGTDVYAYGPPRVGNSAFTKHVMTNLPDNSLNHAINHRDFFFDEPPLYSNVYPEYFIDTPGDQGDVAIGDITEYEDGSGAVDILPENLVAHLYYFQKIRQCKQGIPF